MAIKINAGIPSTKKCFQWEVDDATSKMIFGKKLGQTFKGELVEKPGYEFEITGGSDRTGTPMRRDVEGDRKKKILVVKSVGNKQGRKGMRIRKTMAGNTVGIETVQLNVKVIKEGKTPLAGEPEAKEAPAEEKKVEAEKKVEVKTEKVETKKEEKATEKPAEKKE